MLLVSLSIFLLFWYGPSEPARAICDTKTSQRCTPAKLEVFTEELGYNNAWYTEFPEYVGGIFTGRDITIAIIEHDMHVVFSLAERITVLAQGSPLVEDTPDKIKGHPKVREAYLGESA